MRSFVFDPVIGDSPRLTRRVAADEAHGRRGRGGGADGAVVVKRQRGIGARAAGDGDAPRLVRAFSDARGQAAKVLALVALGAQRSVGAPVAVELYVTAGIRGRQLRAIGADACVAAARGNGAFFAETGGAERHPLRIAFEGGPRALPRAVRYSAATLIEAIAGQEELRLGVAGREPLVHAIADEVRRVKVVVTDYKFLIPDAKLVERTCKVLPT